MKKITLLIIASLLLLTSCAGGGAQASESSANNSNAAANPSAGNQPEAENPSPDNPAESDEPAVNADGYIFVYGDENVYMDEDIKAVLDKLGEPKSTFEAPSCAFDGIDKIFSYTGANIHTYPADGADFVHTVNYMDDSIKTPEGIRLGDSLADVVAAYGEDFTEEMGQYTYIKNETYLRFLIKDDEVINITYGLKEYMEQI